MAGVLDFASGKGWSIDGGDVFGAYEKKGTFTPTLTTSGVDFTSVTYDSAVRGGIYMLIGGGVLYQGSLRTTAVTIGSATGEVQIGGLPLPSTSTGPGQSEISVVTVGRSEAWGANPTAADIGSGSTEMTLRYRATHGSDTSALVPADVGTGSNENFIRVSGWYPID